MRGYYTQSRSSHPRGFTGTLLRPHARTRGAHDTKTLVKLIDVNEASQRLRLSPTSLELGARNGLIPHYYVLGQTRFEAAELDRWIRQHHFDILTSQDDFQGRADS